MAFFRILLFLPFEQNIAFPDEPHGPKHDQKEHNKSLDSEEWNLPGKGLLALFSVGLGWEVTFLSNYHQLVAFAGQGHLALEQGLKFKPIRPVHNTNSKITSRALRL